MESNVWLHRTLKGAASGRMDAAAPPEAGRLQGVVLPWESTNYRDFACA